MMEEVRETYGCEIKCSIFIQFKQQEINKKQCFKYKASK